MRTKTYAAFALLVTAASSQAQAEKKPNIIVILTDDQGWAQNGLFSDRLNLSRCAPEGSLEKYNCCPALAMKAAKESMPFLQQIANEGILFTDAYVASSLCGPSRAALLTGRYPQQFGIYCNDDMMATGIPSAAHLTLLFQQSGYRSAMIGKWHVAKPVWQELNTDCREYYKRWISRCKEGQHPLDCGFDFYYGFNSSGTPYYDSPNIFKDRDTMPVKQSQYITDEFTDQALTFIEQNHASPFFVFLSYSAVHTPLEDKAPDKYLKRFNTGNPETDNYYATLAAVDDGIGRIIQQLKQHDLDNNTLIFFLSDNGAVAASPFPINGEFKGYKGQLNEGGLRIPMVMRWPDKIPEGREYKHPVSAMDVLPTALDAAGIRFRDTVSIDGASLLPYLIGKKSGIEHKTLFWAGQHSLFWSMENNPFWIERDNYLHERQDTLPKITISMNDAPAGFAARKGNWVYTSFITEQPKLYNVTEDPFGKQNLIADYPKVAAEFEVACREWLATLPEPTRWNKESWRKLFE